MKVFFSGYRNPRFVTITEYSERALAKAGAEVFFFNDRDFFIPGRIRQRVGFLEALDLKALNSRLIAAASRERPDVFFACGGTRILPGTLAALKQMGIRTVLWVIDPPREDSEFLLAAAPFYDRIYCGGTEAVEMMSKAGIEGAQWLPFACSPEIHKKQELTREEAAELGCDICFVGSIHPSIYPGRVKMLEALSDMRLKVWGPGAEDIPETSPLRKCLVGGHTPPSLWLKIYSAARIVLCMHFRDPGGKYACYQASPRVYEAMACGSFLLCDAQRDVTTLFRDGSHLAIFNDPADMRKKIEYYLSDPEKMGEIAAAGQREVLAKHTYLVRMEKVLQEVSSLGSR